MSGAPLVVERATLADLDAIDELERHSFPRPWPRATFEAELVAPHARLVVGRAQPAGRAIAFCNYWLVDDDVQIMAIATHPDHRCHGVGAALLTQLLAREAAAGARTTSLEVRAGNRPAIALYLRTGYAVIHTRRAYYADNGEDALVMSCDLSRSA